MLMLPRLLGVLSLLHPRQRRRYGGTAALLGGALVESLLSMLQAPVRMVAHSLFVLAALTGLKLDWKSPSREASTVPWREAALRFGVPGAVALGVLALLWRVDVLAALWLLPIALPLLLAVPLCVAASYEALGRRLRSAGLLLTPEEAWTPTVLRRARQHATAAIAAERAQAAPAVRRAAARVRTA
jgi:membrane glycosyltransferase